MQLLYGNISNINRSIFSSLSHSHHHRSGFFMGALAFVVRDLHHTFPFKKKAFYILFLFPGVLVLSRHAFFSFSFSPLRIINVFLCMCVCTVSCPAFKSV